MATSKKVSPKKQIVKQKIVAPPSSVYRRIAFSFIGAAVVLLAVVLYVSLAKAIIIVHPKHQSITTTFSADVNGAPADGEVRGIIFATDVTDSRLFSLGGTGEGHLVEVPATGTVTVHNTTSKAQPLVTSTRLLSKSGVLFHINKTVLVPAGGSVAVDIYADKPGPAGEISETQFTIPGLWPGIQDKIYAISTAPTCCSTRTIRTISEEDISKATTELTDALLAKASDVLRAQVGDSIKTLGGEVFLPTVINVQSDMKAGTEGDAFTLKEKLHVVGVFYDRTAIETEARTSFDNLAGADRELAELDSSQIKATITQVDTAKKTARLAVEATGALALQPGSTLLRTERLQGLDRAAVESYFKASSVIDSVEVQFIPAWLTHVPKLQDHIEIKIAN